MNNKTNSNFSLRKLILTALVAGPLAMLPAPLWALPGIGPANLATSAGVTVTQPNGTTINVSAPDRAVLSWTEFGGTATNTIAVGDVINYVLPSQGSSILNLVTGTGASLIEGTLASNGSIYILNPNGVAFSNTATVNSAGLTVSTVNEPLAASGFQLNGNLSLVGPSDAAKGAIAIYGGNFTALGIGNNITLAGNGITIGNTAPGGTIGGSGASFFYGNLTVKGVGASASAQPNAIELGKNNGVNVKLVGSPATAGALTINSSGANVTLTAGAAVAADSNLTINTVNSYAPSAGYVDQKNAAQLSAGATSITAATTGAANYVKLANSKLTSLVIPNAGATSVVNTGNSTGFTVGNITITASDLTGPALADTLTITNPNSDISTTTGTAITVNPTTTYTAPTVSVTAKNNVTLNANGALTFTTLKATTTATVTSNSDINLTWDGVTGAGATKNLVLTTTNGKVTATKALNNSSTTKITATGDIKLDASAIGAGTVNLTTSAGSITTSGAVINAYDLTLSASAGTLTIAGATTNTTSSITAGGDIKFTDELKAQTRTLTLSSTNGSIAGTKLTASTTTNITAQTGVNFTSASSNSGTTTITTNTGDIKLDSQISPSAGLSLTATAGAVTINGIKSTTTSTISLKAANDIKLDATGLNELTIPVLSVTSTAGSITQGAAITSTSKATFDALKDITLDNASNALASVVLLNAGGGTSGAIVKDTDGINIASGTNLKSNLKVTGGSNSVVAGGNNVTLGTSGADSITVLGNVELTAQGTGAIGTSANTVYIGGSVSLTTTSQAATLGVSNAGANSSFGQVNAALSGGTLTVSESTTLNLGKISAGDLVATSLNGDIVNSGAVTISGDATLSANTFFNPGNVTLNNSGNTFANGKKVYVVNANNVSVSNAVDGTGGAVTWTLLNGKDGMVGRGIVGSASVTTTNKNNVIFDTKGGGVYSTVGFSATGGVTVNNPGSLTLQNATTSSSNSSNINVTAGNATLGGVLTLGSGITLLGSGTTTFKAQGTGSSIVDSASNIVVFGGTVFASDNNISITKSGHSFGAVSLFSGANNAGGTVATSNTDITYTEAGSANLNEVLLNGAALGLDGSLKVVSTSGGILQTPTTGYIIVPSANGANTVNFTAATGVVLNNPNTAGVVGRNNLIVPAVNLTATSDSTVYQSKVVLAGPVNVTADLTLGNVVVSNGGFTASIATADTGALAGSKIKQAAGTSISSFGSTAFRSNGGSITVANAGNSFGALTIASTNGNVSIAEGGTVNFASVTTGTGNLTVSSGGSIIQSGGTITVGGTASYTAGAGGITLSSNNPSLGATGIALITPGSVTLTDNAAGGTILAATTNVGGSLTVRNLSNAAIKDNNAGNITVTGGVLLDAGTGDITLTGANIQLGAVQFRGANVSISEATTFNLAAGSIASGNVSLSSLQNIITSGAGTSIFTGANGLTLAAAGNITITNPIFVSKGLTFRATGAVDLSALSKANNLNGNDPTNLGAASYKGPGQ